MNPPFPSDADRPAPEAAAAVCPCGHPVAAHDSLGTRFCAATVSANLNRKCICAGEVSAAGALANY